MMKMRMGGATFKAIGERYDLSPERVRQIVRKRQRIADMCENDR